MNKEQIQFISNLCFALGFLSIIGSVMIWFSAGGQFGAPGMGDAVAEAKRAYAERFGIFVGIWPPKRRKKSTPLNRRWRARSRRCGTAGSVKPVSRQA